MLTLHMLNIDILRIFLYFLTPDSSQHRKHLKAITELEGATEVSNQKAMILCVYSVR